MAWKNLLTLRFLVVDSNSMDRTLKLLRSWGLKLRVVRWRILKNWVPKSKRFDIEAEIKSSGERQGYKTMEIPIKYRDRLGEKKLKLKHGFTILKRIIVVNL